MSITIEFRPWSKFRAKKDTTTIKRWLKGIGESSENAFRSGMGGGGSPSSPGAWPNSQTGRLKGSIDSKVTANSVTIGTGTHYSGYLRSGTSKMSRRKMSDNALREGMRGARLGRWCEWTRS